MISFDCKEFVNRFDVTISEAGCGDVIYQGVEASCKREAMADMLNLHREMMNIPNGVELVATARFVR